jgi:hypothetical protein
MGGQQPAETASVAPSTSVSTSILQPQANEISGRVIDMLTRQPVSGAAVSALNRGESIASTRTSSAGNYSLGPLDEGVYLVLVEIAGYRPEVRSDVRLVRGKVAVADFEMVRAGTVSEEIVVTARATADDPRLPVSRFSYSREEIRRSPGSAGDVLRALDSLPGVNSTGEFSSFTVRGRGPRDNLILVDGIPFDKVTHFDQTLGENEDVNGGGRYSIFAPNLIQEVDFLPGGFDVPYGGKSGSLLKLTVAEGNRVTPSVSGRVEITGWEANYDGPSFVFDNTSVLFSARGQYFERLFELIGEGTIGAPVLYDFIAKTTSDISPDHSLSVLGIFAPEKYSRDIGNVLADEDLEDTSIARSRQDSLLLGGTWRWLTGSSSYLENRFFYRHSDRESSQGETFPELVDGSLPDPESVPIRPDIIQAQEGEVEYGWRGDFSLVTADSGVFAAGGRLTRVELDSEIVLDGPWVRYVYDQNDSRPDPSRNYIVLLPEFVNSSFRSEGLRAASYVEHALSLGDSFTLTPGIRYDWDGITSESLWSPRISANWAIDPRTRLSFATGIYYQQPLFLELALDPANVGLENEKSSQVVLGVGHYLRNGMRLSAEGYYQRLENLILIPDRTTGAANNSAEGFSTGIDIGLVRPLRDNWYAQVTYGYQVAEIDQNLGQGPFASDFNRPHTFNVFFAYELNDSWSFAAKWRYASGRPTDDYIVHDDVFNNPDFLRFSKEITDRNVQRLPAFHTLNVRVDYRRRFGPVSLIAFVDFFNVYNHKNVNFVRWLERKGENKLSGLEAFPTFGIKFEM